MAIRSRVQLRKDAEHKRQSEITDKAVRKAEKNHLVKHPINRYRRLRDDTNAAVQKRKQQLLDNERVPDYQNEKLKFMLIALGVMALITLLLLI